MASDAVRVDDVSGQQFLLTELLGDFPLVAIGVLVNEGSKVVRHIA